MKETEQPKGEPEVLDTPELLQTFKEVTSEVDPEILDDDPEMIKAAYDEFIKDSYDPSYEEELTELEEEQ
jgi:hypothetical protein